MTRPRLTSARKPMPAKPPARKAPKKPKVGTAGPRSAGYLQRAIDDLVRREIEKALGASGGNVVHAAHALGISQPSLYGRMGVLGIDPNKFRR